MKTLCRSLILATCLAAPLAGAQAVDPATVPVSKAALPAFPFVQLPKESPTTFSDREISWDRVYVLAGSQLRPVEGRFRLRSFSVKSAGLSTDGVMTHYERAIGALGGVKLATYRKGQNGLLPANDAERDRVFRKLRQFDSADVLEQYLIRSPQGNVWISVAVFDGELNGSIAVVQEQPFKPSVNLLKAQQ